MNSFNLPVFSWPLTLSISIIVMIARYFLLSGLAYLYCEKLDAGHRLSRRIEAGKLRAGQNRKDIIWSILSSVIFALSGTFIIHLWHAGKIEVYLEPQKYGFTYLILSFFLLAFLHDTYFYWTHRLLHLKKFYQFHKVHHESRIPTAWTAFSFHPVEAIIQAIILPVLLWIFPLHWSVLIAFLSMMTVLGIINHLGYEFYPAAFRHSFPTKYLINATHHQKHHGKVTKNYGLYFTLWDLWTGTEDRGEQHG